MFAINGQQNGYNPESFFCPLKCWLGGEYITERVLQSVYNLYVIVLQDVSIFLMQVLQNVCDSCKNTTDETVYRSILRGNIGMICRHRLQTHKKTCMELSSVLPCIPLQFLLGF